MIHSGIDRESRRTIVIDVVRSFFPTYNHSSDEVFETIEEHIHAHGYFLQTAYGVDISESAYFTSWLEYVLEPILTSISAQCNDTNLIDPLEEYIVISKIWFSLPKNQPLYNLEYLQEALKIYLALKEE